MMNLFMKNSMPVLFFIYSFGLFVGISLMELFSWLIAIIVIISCIKTTVVEKKKKSNLKFRLFPEGLLVLFLLVVAIGVFINESSTAWHESIGSARWTLLFILLSVGFRCVPLKSVERNIKYIFILAFAVSSYSIIQYFTGIDITHVKSKIPFFETDSGNYYRSGGLFGAPMTYGNSMGVFFFIPLGLILSNVDFTSSLKNKKNILLLILLFFIGFSLVTTYTRGVWLALFLTTAVVVGFYNLKSFILFLFSGCIFSAIVLYLNKGIYQRFITIFDPEYISNYDRINIWRAHWAMFLDYPFFGVGYSQNSALVEGYYQKLNVESDFFSHAHNNILQLLSTTGIFGFLLYVLFSFFFLTISYKLWRKLPKNQVFFRGFALGSLGSQIFLHVSGLTENNFFDGEVTHIYLFILIIILVIYEKHGAYLKE